MNEWQKGDNIVSDICKQYLNIKINNHYDAIAAYYNDTYQVVFIKHYAPGSNKVRKRYF